MPGNIIIPPSVMYSGTAYARQSLLLSAPVEGNRVVPLSINWGNDAASLQAVQFNLQSITTLPIKQICAMYVNNLMSNVDAVFKFPDIPFQLTVPAQSEGLYPVDTNSLQFVVQAGAGIGTTTDQVFFNVYNFLPPPVAIARVFTANIAAASGFTPTTGGNQVIPAGTNGIISSLNASAVGLLSGAGVGTLQLQFQDGEGTPKVIAIGGVSIPATTTFNGTIITMTGSNVSFINGLQLLITASGTAFAAGGIEVNVYWR